MGSAEIRGLINDEPQQDFPEFSISGPGLNSPVRNRVKSLIARLTLQTNERVSKERERELSSKDIYTKKSRFSQNVHYLSKTTDKTLFVDTGTAIAMRRTGITEAGVGVALQLATQRFGSTLTINGSAEFKRLVVEAAAKGAMDIHFTDKKMNEALTLRRAELDIGKEAEQIQSPETAGAEAPRQEAITPGEEAAPVVVDRSVVVGELVAHGADSYKGDPKNGDSYYVELNTEAGPRKLWGVALEEVMEQQNFALGDRIKLKDLGREPVTIQKVLPDGSTSHVPGFRRAWSAEPETTSVVRNTAASDAATPAPAPAPAPAVAQVPAQAVPHVPEVAERATPTLESAPEIEQHEGSGVSANVAAGVSRPADSGASPSELVRREEAWRQKFPLTAEAVLTEAEVLSSDTMMGLRGEDHAMWLVATSDHTKEGVAMITAYMENDEYRDRFKTTLEDLYDQHQDSPETIEALDGATGFVVPIVHEIERRLSAAATATVDPKSQAVPGPLNFTHNGEAASLGLKPVPESPSPVVESAVVAHQVASPASLNFTHNGEAASLGLKPVPASPSPVVESAVVAHQVASPAPLNFTHQGQPASLGLTPITAQEVPNTAAAAQPDRASAPAPLSFTHQGQPASLGLRTDTQSTTEYQCPDESPAMAQMLRDPDDSNQSISLGGLLNRIDHALDALRAADSVPSAEVDLLNDVLSRMADPAEKQLLDTAIFERYIGVEEDGPNMD
ncbi:LPD7 domain-containing protein [Pseudomonas fluorescens]|nr:LPD7 domain-containing protein [Pseudomonas fluorescens]